MNVFGKILVIGLLLSACSKAATPAANSLGAAFPTVRGESLEKESVELPTAYRGKNTVVLVGYLQKAQFDIDRWILGLLQLETPVSIVEVPTIAGMMPQVVQSFINNGMRKGIPESDWKSVVTVYEDADKIVKVLGNERPQNAYAVLLDKDGTIRKVFSDGYSATNVRELDKLARELY